VNKDVAKSSSSEIAGSINCSVCEELLKNIQRFFNMLQSAKDSQSSDWLTVEDVAKELKISKSIVYRIIRNGELEAVNIVDRGNIKNIESRKTFTFKGHYRINKASLVDYLQKKKVQPPAERVRRRPTRKFPEVKNHLEL